LRLLSAPALLRPGVRERRGIAWVGAGIVALGLFAPRHA